MRVFRELEPSTSLGGKNQAFYDTLTGLPDRALLRDWLQHALTAATRRQRQAALLHIDLDNFKSVNDTHGP